MPKYQAVKEAIEAFQPGGADVSILCATLEVNEKGFRALLGRKPKARPGTALWIGVLLILALSVAFTLVFRGAGTLTFGAFVPIFVVFFLFRTTLITVGDSGLDFYFAEPHFGSKYVAYEKMSLPYDRITNVEVKTGRWNTTFTIEFSNGDKNIKLKTSVSNKMKKMEEQAENLKYLREVLKKVS